MSAAKLMDGLSPVQWRALNALFYAGSGGVRAMVVRSAQRIEYQQLIDLEAGEFITARLASRVKVKLADVVQTHLVWIYLAERGKRRVVSNRANQVITCLGGKPNHAARVRDLKGEGMADDDLLLEMGAAGLIAVRLESGAELSVVGAFKRLPRDLVLRLTNTGRAYFPLDMVGASA